MPEGDAVRRTARRLDAAMVGERLQHADLRVPRAATVDLVGCEVLPTAVVGKHLLTRLRRESDGAELTLHSHLRMDGRWAIGAAGPRPIAGPAHQIRVWLVGQRRQAVGLRLMEVAVIPTADEDTLIGHLGPDILGEAWSPAVAAGVADRIAAAGSRGLVATLLDQRVVCGIGTMWAAELAFAAGVAPQVAASDSPDLVPALHRIRSRMRTAILADKRASRVRLNVFERAGQPCLRCGTVIRSGRVGTPPQDRVTYWCPRCQPGADT